MNLAHPTMQVGLLWKTLHWTRQGMFEMRASTKPLTIEQTASYKSRHSVTTCSALSTGEPLLFLQHAKAPRALEDVHAATLSAPTT